MQIKFYKYNNLDICPNKLKSAALVETIDIDAPQIMQNLGISFLLDRAIQANIAEYWLKGIQYIAYVDYSTSGNNMYTYKLTIDNLATAWYNKCFDRYNMVARSNLGNFKNDSSLLRDTQVQTATYTMDDISQDYRIIMNVYTPEANTDYLSSRYQVSNKGIRTYLFTPAQWNAYYNWLSINAGTDPTLADVANSVKSIYIIDTKYILSSLFTSGAYPRLYSVAGSNLLKVKVPSNQDSPFTETGLPSVQTGAIVGSNRTVPIRSTLSTPIEINEDTITGSLTYNLKTGVKISIPLTNVPKHISTITTIGYDISIDYKTCDFITYPVINGETLYEYIQTGNVAEDLPFMYDSTIISNTERAFTTIQILGTIATAAIGTGITAAGLGAGIVTNKIIAGTGQAIANTGSSVLGAVAREVQSNVTGTTIKFSAGGNPYTANVITSKLTFTYTPTVNKQDYQDRFGKADYTSRNITQLTGPVQTINCVASMNNLNINIINIATQLCNNGIWIL